MYPTVMLRLDVEAMRYQVVHAFMNHTKEVEEEINRAVEAALKEFDFMAVIRQEVDRVMRDAIKGAVTHAASTALYDPAISKLISEGTVARLERAIKTALKEVSI